MKLNKFLAGGSVVAMGLGAMGSANAAFDITAITAAGADVGLVGAAVFSIVVAIKVFQWVRRAL